MDLAELTYETAKALEGTVFHVELPPDLHLVMHLKEVLAYETGERRRGATSRRSPFSLYFLGPGTPILPQAMYTLRSDSMVFDKVFIVPIGRNGDGIDYEAVFN